MKPFYPIVALVALLACALAPGAAPAALTEREIASVALAPPPEARIPASLTLQDLSGRQVALSAALAGRPALLVPVDFTCRTMCGAALTIVSNALVDSGLTPKLDYQLIVWGFDAKDSAADARAMLAERIPDRALAAAALVLRADAATDAALARALGHRAAYDAEADQFAHPSGALAIAPDGRIARVLSILALGGRDLRLALIEAGQGKIGGAFDRITLLCSRFDPVHGVYTLAIRRALEVAAMLTLATLAGAILLLLRHSRARTEEA